MGYKNSSLIKVSVYLAQEKKNSSCSQISGEKKGKCAYFKSSHKSRLHEATSKNKYLQVVGSPEPLKKERKTKGQRRLDN